MWIHFKAWLLRFQFGSLTVSLILVSFHLNNLWIVTATLTDSVLYYWIKPGTAGSGITSVYSSYVSVRICFIVDTSLKYWTRIEIWDCEHEFLHFSLPLIFEKLYLEWYVRLLQSLSDDCFHKSGTAWTFCIELVYSLDFQYFLNW